MWSGENGWLKSESEVTLFIYSSGVKVLLLLRANCCFCLSPSPFLCFPPSAHSWQFARHGDKVSEKKEQNVRIKLHLLCSSLCFCFSHPPPFPLSPLISAAGENNAVFLILPASVVRKRTIEAIFSRQGIDELYIPYTFLPCALK